MDAAVAVALETPAGRSPDRSLAWPIHWSAVALVATTWISAGIFGAYILAFYAGSAFNGSADLWNEILPGLHDAAAPAATAGIAVHFVAGGILLMLGPVQLLGSVRRRIPRLHRWTGRLYVLAAMFAGLGGLAFIGLKGTIGGAVMNVGFALYGALVTLAAFQTFAHARGRRFEQHRAWAIRLFALTVGSWLYRMEYGLWFLAVGELGHTDRFTGWFDAVMVFFFYFPNLAVAELCIRSRERSLRGAGAVSAVAVLLAATAFVAVATVFFTTRVWGPGIRIGLAF